MLQIFSLAHSNPHTHYYHKMMGNRRFPRKGSCRPHIPHDSHFILYVALNMMRTGTSVCGISSMPIKVFVQLLFQFAPSLKHVYVDRAYGTKSLCSLNLANISGGKCPQCGGAIEEDVIKEDMPLHFVFQF
ncbi:hypothetical protein CDAR_368221 [Caerostris darwini]|uniref:Transposase n=1 Tax=Caerostris darwini TaxID=1538125 RepID=A0AAV4WF89_9ARAC|nr:hypothetical protein CDAR_368221 [Caerostris darwini]